MVDVKKLITGFLILATLASSLAFLFSNYVPTIATSPNEAAINFTLNEPPPLPDNVFVEPVPNATPQTGAMALSAGTPHTNGDLPPPPSSSNLTENLVQSMTREFFVANPRGPQTDAEGQMGVAFPKADSIVGAFVKNPVVKKISMPDWEAEATAQKFAIIENATLVETMQYQSALQGVYEKNFLRSDLESSVASMSLTGDTRAVAAAMNKALDESVALRVPEQFVALHRSGVKVLIYARNVLRLAENADTDPLRFSLVMAAQEKNYRAAIADFSSEMKKAFSLSSAAPSKTRQIVAALFGISTAHAQYVDIPAGVQRPVISLMEKIWRIVEGTILQLLKNVLTDRFANGIVNWVSGGGTPLFITDWKSFLKNAYNTAAASAIGEWVPNLCQAFRMPIQIGLKNTFGGGGGFPTGCTLDQLVGNIQGFYQNFETGGWIAYGQTTLPSGNYYGSLFLSQNQIAKKAQDSADASKNEGIASKGFLSVKQCPANSYKGGDGTCYSTDGQNTEIPAQNVTPGAAVSDTVGKALGASHENVVNANSITGLLASFVGSLVNSFITKGASLLRP